MTVGREVSRTSSIRVLLAARQFGPNCSPPSTGACSPHAGMTWSEVMSRITVHLTVSSAALVVLALVTQATGFGVAFHVLSIGLTSAILVLGTLTGVRVHNASREDAAIILGMNRLRAAYVEMDPGIAEYLVTSQYDDQAGLMTTYTMGMRRSTVSHVIGSTSMFINIVNAIVAGTLGALIADAAAGDPVATSLGRDRRGRRLPGDDRGGGAKVVRPAPAARTISDWLGLGRRGTTGRGRVVDSAHAPELARCRSGRTTAGRATRSSMVGIRPPRGFDLARRRVHRRRRLRAAVPIAATPGPFVVGGRGGRGCRAVRVRHERQRTEGVALEGRAPAQGSRAWYGNLVAGRGSFLSPTMLSLLYTGAGAVDDHETAELSHTAHEIAAALANEPLPSATLRSIVGDRNRYQRAIVELQRHLLVTHAGVHEHPTGWPSALLDLTCRRFDVRGGPDHAMATRLFLGTVLQATPAELGRAFRWPVGQARGRARLRWWQRARQRWTARCFAAAEREQSAPT